MMERVLVSRHLEDKNNLKDGLDTSLKEEQSEESLKALSDFVREIIESAREKNKKNILLIHSPRKRAEETGRIISSKIKKESEFRVRMVKDGRFAELDHGKVILPESYTPGSRLEFLSQAWKIFWDETFDKESFSFKNNYHFGDPVLMENGKYKYPELKSSFAEPGESYLELTIRYYEGILEFLKNKDRIDNSKSEFVLVAHSATLSILKQLYSVISRNNFKEGELLEACWKEYNLSLKRPDYKKSTFGDFSTFDISNLDIEKTIKILEKELKVLKNKYEK